MGIFNGNDTRSGFTVAQNISIRKLLEVKSIMKSEQRRSSIVTAFLFLHSLLDLNGKISWAMDEETRIVQLGRIFYNLQLESEKPSNLL